jgi:hypothetical protein
MMRAAAEASGSAKDSINDTLTVNLWGPCDEGKRKNH